MDWARACITALTAAGIVLPGIGLFRAYRAAAATRDRLDEEVAFKRAAWKRFVLEARPDGHAGNRDEVARAKVRLQATFASRDWQPLDFDTLNVVVEETDARRLRETLLDLRAQLAWFIAGAIAGLGGAVWDVWLN